MFILYFMFWVCFLVVGIFEIVNFAFSGRLVLFVKIVLDSFVGYFMIFLF